MSQRKKKKIKLTDTKVVDENEMVLMLRASRTPDGKVNERLAQAEDFIIRAVNSHDALLEACKATDIYFKALCEQWAAHDGRVVTESGTVIEGAEEIERLCEIAGEKVMKAISQAEGKL